MFHNYCVKKFNIFNLTTLPAIIIALLFTLSASANTTNPNKISLGVLYGDIDGYAQIPEGGNPGPPTLSDLLTKS